MLTFSFFFYLDVQFSNIYSILRVCIPDHPRAFKFALQLVFQMFSSVLRHPTRKHARSTLNPYLTDYHLNTPRHHPKHHPTSVNILYYPQNPLATTCSMEYLILTAHVHAFPFSRPLDPCCPYAS
jgi:hypothetical protein